MRKADYFWDWFFSLGEGAETSWIEVRINLFDKLEGDKIEDKGFLVKDDDHHVISQLYVHNQFVRIQRDLCPIFLLMIVPDDNFVPLLLVD